MRAKKLIISAFGPFAKETVIDFEEFGDRGIFLITGDTGAGKTTIFDAISFALFGASSGGVREVKMLRSEYAEPETESFVDLTFSYKNREYNIRRIPAYYRPKKRGEGLTRQEMEAVLTFDDGSNISNLTEVNNYIVDLFSVNEEQFKQVAMLAQGDFLKLLHASNEEKRALFRKIFSTEKYSIFEDRIRTLRSETLSEARNLSDNFETLVDALIIEPEKKTQSLTLAKTDKEAFENFIESEQELLRSKASEEATSLKELNKTIDKKKETLIKVREYASLVSDINSKIKSLNKENDNLAKLEKQKEDQKDIDQRIDGLRNRYTLEESLLDRYDELDLVSASIDSLKEAIKTDVEMHKTQSTKLSDKKDELRKNKEFIKDHAHFEKDAISLNAELEKMTTKLNSIEKLFNNYQTLVKDKARLEKKNREVEEALENFKNKNSEYLKATETYYASQAGLLASTLEKGIPCPVCGSLEHPEPAHLAEGFVDKATLDTLSSQVETNRSTLEKKNQERISITTKIESESKSLEDGLVAIGLDSPELLSSKLEETKVEKTGISDKYKHAEEMAKEVSIKRGEIDGLESSVEVLDKKVDELDNRLNINRTKLDSQSEKKAEISKGLKYQSREEASDALKKLSDDAAKLKKDKDDLEQSIIDTNLKISSLKSSISTLEKNKEDKYNLDADLLSKEIEEMEAKTEVLNKEIGQLFADIKSNDTVKVRYREHYARFKKVEEKYRHVNDIYEIVTGQISGKDKLQFEVFVQMHYFDEIIMRANKRFYDMTSGQYQMRRKADASDNVSQSGLEIEILDKFSQKARHIKTLSGGESFKAALALALALSDTVQMYSGGVEFDSMFIDEGFGSLDKESLSQVMASLATLTEGKKLIGIISHVESLKDAIDKKIIVTKDRAGISHVELVN